MPDVPTIIEQTKRLIDGHKTAVQASLMGVILVIAIALRVQPSRWGDYLNEYDPFYWNRVAEYIAKNGFGAWATWKDTLSWYPMGNDVAHSSLVGNPFSAAIIYWLLNGIGFHVFRAHGFTVLPHLREMTLGGASSGIMEP